MMELDSEAVFNSDNESIQSGSNSSADEQGGGEEIEGNPGLADALAKVIRMSRKKNGKSMVLSKAKLYDPNQNETKKENDFVIVPDPNVKIDVVDVKPTVSELEEDKKLMKKRAIKKQERLHRGRLKPSPLDREKERPLVRIATKGVVQLFNAVRQQQLKINKQIHKPGITEGKKEKILKSVDKNTFLEVLKGKHSQLKSSQYPSDEVENDIKEEPEDEEPSWQVLRDDFMMGAKLKDWDKNDIEIE